MKALGQLALAMLTALGAFMLVVAAISLSLVEGASSSALVVSEPTATSPAAITTPQPETLQTAPSQPTATRMPSATTTATSAVAFCPPPKGWQAYTLQAGDTLASLAERTGSTEIELKEANCLIGSTLLSGTIVYLPDNAPVATLTTIRTPVPTGTQTSACTPPWGWVTYTVQRYDTLYQLGKSFGVSAQELKDANCLVSNIIVVGDQLYVPNIPTRTPEFRATQKPAATSTAVPPTSTVVLITQAPILPTSTPPPPATDTPVIPTETTLPTNTPNTPTETTPPTVTPDIPTETPLPTADSPTLTIAPDITTETPQPDMGTHATR